MPAPSVTVLGEVATHRIALNDQTQTLLDAQLRERCKAAMRAIEAAAAKTPAKAEAR